MHDGGWLARRERDEGHRVSQWGRHVSPRAMATGPVSTISRTRENREGGARSQTRRSTDQLIHKGNDTMRLWLFTLAILGLFGMAAGCSHTSGMCDCPPDYPHYAAYPPHINGSMHPIDHPHAAPYGDVMAPPRAFPGGSEPIPIGPPKRLPSAPGSSHSRL
jgi:hypothetical protein